MKPIGSRKNFLDAFLKETGWDATDWVRARFLAKEMSNEDIDEAHLTSKLGRHPGLVRTRAARDQQGKINQALERLGMENETGTRMAQAGQVAGTVLSDFRDDSTRSWWWLVNAIPATSSLIAEQAYRSAAGTKLNAVSPVINKKNDIQFNVKNPKDRIAAVQQGIASGKIDYGPTGEPEDVAHFALKADYQSTGGKVGKRQYKGGHIAALTLPQALAVNTAMGLMSPFGGIQGYEAALPSEEDPTKTSNVMGEIAAKYFLGRTGNLLPYEEFKKVRPDVSRGEYNAYKAFKYDKNGDFDLSDGDFTVPMGVLKGTTTGIHGPEIQFLGKSMPLTTGILPYAATVAGGVAGAFVPTKKHLVRNMFLGSSMGMSTGMFGGNLIEEERRRRNDLANNPVNVDVGF